MTATRFIRLAALLCLASAGQALVAQPPPPPVPPVPVPIENPITDSKRVLGKILFWDEQLSSDNTMACGTCHLPEIGGADARPATHPGFDGVLGTADDVEGSGGVLHSDAMNAFEPDPTFGANPQITGRSAPSAMNGLWSPSQFWDGRANGRFLDPENGVERIGFGGSLENQVVGPPMSSVEMAHEDRDWGEVAKKLAVVDPLRLATNLPPDVAAVLAGGAGYPALFQAAFGTPEITATRIAFAIATYERTLVANQTPWDLFNNGNPAALTQNQLGGLNFLRGSVCFQCHTPPLFTDNQFHNIGLRPWQEDEGRMDVTGNFADRGRFKTASLRNAGLRRKLMHVGWVTDVRDALDFYRSNTTPGTGHVQFADGQDPRVRGINIPPNVLPQVTDFIANALTDPRVRNRQFPFDRPTLLRERAGDRPVVFGPASPGSGGIAPRMLAPTQLAINNPDFRVAIDDGLGGAPAFLLLALSQSVPGTFFGSVPIHVELSDMLITLPVGLAGTGAGNGYGTWGLSIGDDPAVIGVDVFGQWLVIDAAAPENLASSQGAHWRVL